MKKIISIALFTVFTVTGFFFATNSNAFFGPWASKYQKVEAVNGMVTVPIDKINDGMAHYFTFNAQGRNINFFVIKSRDGIIRAAFDTCDVCFPERKGYSQAGDFMVCNNCGQRFHTTKINVIKGGCNPAPLRRVNNGKELVISANDIFTGFRYF